MLGTAANLSIPGLINGPYPEKPHLRPGTLRQFKSYCEKQAAKASAASRNYGSSVDQIKKLAAIYARMNSQQFMTTARSVRQKLHANGLIPPYLTQALALSDEAIFRETGLRVYESQIMAAVVMLDGRLAEMHTGEGKTFSTILAAGAAGLAGIPTHVLTANDYLVDRDAEQARAVLKRLGLSVGCVLTGQSPEVRREQYAKDVTYSTAKEVVFDYLKDLRVRNRGSKGLSNRAAALDNQVGDGPLLRGLCFALVDEADSIFLDEAVTPLILSRPGKSPVSEADYRLAMRIAQQLDEGLHYEAQLQHREIRLLAAGENSISQSCAALKGLWNVSRFRESLIKQAVTAWHGFNRDRDYIVRDGEIHIIDQTTGRVAEGRQWSNGLHQMIEIKEDCEVSDQNETIAQITYQTFFPRYLKLGGTSATLTEARSELLQIYALPVVKIPRHQNSKFQNLGEKTFVCADQRWQHMLHATRLMVEQGRPVLIGTDSIETSQTVSAVLDTAGIHHQVLNAAQDEDEASIVSQAGRSGRVTVSTNIAGRGTDIKLPANVRAAGGLHVINCQHNPSRRVDRQLKGRSARQGDPGSAETLVSLDDLMFRKHLPISLQRTLAAVFVKGRALPRCLAWPLGRWTQFRSEFEQREQRSQLRKNDQKMRDWLALGGAGE